MHFYKKTKNNIYTIILYIDLDIAIKINKTPLSWVPPIEVTIAK